jgi:hypothetical protein
LPPSTPPSIKLVSIGGVAVTNSELTIKSSSATVIVEARNIPPGTPAELHFFADSGAEQTITTTPLDGTFELSQASAEVTFRNGFSHVYVKSNWKQPE